MMITWASAFRQTKRKSGAATVGRMLIEGLRMICQVPPPGWPLPSPDSEPRDTWPDLRQSLATRTGAVNPMIDRVSAWVYTHPREKLQRRLARSLSGHEPLQD